MTWRITVPLVSSAEHPEPLTRRTWNTFGIAESGGAVGVFPYRRTWDLRPSRKNLEERNSLDPNKDGEILLVIHKYARCLPLVSLIYGFPPRLLYIGNTGLCGREQCVILSNLASATTVTNPYRKSP